MKVHLKSDGRVFDGEAAVYEAGDVAWFEEAVLLVTKVDGDMARAIVHPAAIEMMHAALNFGPKGADGMHQGIAEAMRIHARTMARGYLAAIAFVKSADLNSTGGGRAGIAAGEVEFDALGDLLVELEKAQEIVKPRKRTRRS